MKNRTNRKPRVGLWVKGILLGLLGLSMANKEASAQDNHAIPKSYLNKGKVHLPIQIDDRVRAQLQEVQLYVKDGPQAPWILKEKVPGTQTFFTFQAAHEGEYWFNVVTVDRAGRAIPADVNKEPPGLIVIIDSTPPQAEAQVLASTPEGQPVHCEIHDLNADPSKTRFFYQTRDQVWRSCDAVNGQQDNFCIPAQAALTGMIRVVATDLAGNTSTREFNLATLPADNMPGLAQAAATMPIVNMPVANVPPVTTHRNAPSVMPVDLPPEKMIVSQAPVLPPGPPLPPLESMSTPRPPVSAEPVPTRSPETAITPRRIVEAASLPFSAPIGNEVRVGSEGAVSSSVNQFEVPAKRHIVNNCHVFLNYEIEQAGISGVGRVEVWYTRDMGKTWQKLTEDLNRKGQAEVDLPGEGIFGATVVVANGRGFGANPPQSGDTPDYWIEIDTTKPRAELLNVRSNPNGDDGALHITWSAKDKNLHAEPIDLYYAINRQGPWVPIAKGLKNEGLYRWTPAPEIGSHAFIRLAVHDQAGNMASSETVQPVALDDLSRPRGRISGVTTQPRNILGSGLNPLPPSGN